MWEHYDIFGEKESEQGENEASSEASQGKEASKNGNNGKAAASKG